ncbi:hypothetical protein ABT112_23695 [Streptomyces sp. NPDC002055]|uniref:hypothetical protein n=1 Tax=Streptomyces sp. NPDC002055 TaxID=3154534 RepID=UPI00331721C5
MALDEPPSGLPAQQYAVVTGGHRFEDAAARIVGDQRLPCGRPLSHVWEQARDGIPVDPHTADCPHCREAVAGLAALDEATHALRAQERPSGQTLAERVMTAVRAETRLGRMLPLGAPTEDLRIAETEAARVLRRAADSVPGARAVSCRLTTTDDGGRIRVVLTLAVGLDRPLDERAAQVRRAVVRTADRALGLALADVDLKIVDTLEPHRLSAPGETGHREGDE